MEKLWQQADKKSSLSKNGLLPGFHRTAASQLLQAAVVRREAEMMQTVSVKRLAVMTSAGCGGTLGTVLSRDEDAFVAIAARSLSTGTVGGSAVCKFAIAFGCGLVLYFWCGDMMLIRAVAGPWCIRTSWGGGWLGRLLREHDFW